MELPLEFSFKLDEYDEKIFYSTKHDRLSEYMISWNIGERIWTTHYTAKTVEDLITNRNWILIDVYK